MIFHMVTKWTTIVYLFSAPVAAERIQQDTLFYWRMDLPRRQWLLTRIKVGLPTEFLNASTVIAPCADTKSTGPYLVKVMARLTIDRIPVGPMLDALTAEKVFGWKSVHKHGGSLVGRKQDRAGHWRLAKVPYFSTNFLHAYGIVGRVKDLGRLDRFRQELAKTARFTKIPSDWAWPDQCCRAAIKAVGQYGQVIPLNSSRRHIQR